MLLSVTSAAGVSRAEHALRLLQTALQIADRLQHPQVDSEVDDRLGDLDDNPVITALAPINRAASTVCTRWFATVSSTVATPVISITTTLRPIGLDRAKQLLGELARAR